MTSAALAEVCAELSAILVFFLYLCLSVSVSFRFVTIKRTHDGFENENYIIPKTILRIKIDKST